MFISSILIISGLVLWLILGFIVYHTATKGQLPFKLNLGGDDQDGDEGADAEAEVKDGGDESPQASGFRPISKMTERIIRNMPIPDK